MATLYLRDGTCFSGDSIGADVTLCAPVWYAQGLCGLRDILRQNIYVGKIVVISSVLLNSTYDEGLYGAAGIVLREYDQLVDDGALMQFLLRHEIPAMANVDIRAMYHALQAAGTQMAVLSTQRLSGQAWHDAFQTPPAKRKSFPSKIKHGNDAVRIAVLGNVPMATAVERSTDYMVGCFSPEVELDELADFSPTAMVLCAQPEKTNIVEGYVGRLPILAVGQGYAVIARILGMPLETMPQAHGGFGIPVQDVGTGRVLFTQQMHRRCADVSGMDGLEVTYRHLADSTVEGFYWKDKQVWATTFMPGNTSEKGQDVLAAFLANVQKG